MAIKKSDVKTFDEGEVGAIEKRIDGRLMLPQDGMLTFETRGWTNATRREIQRRYEAAGWKVEFISDQREGDFMVLK